MNLKFLLAFATNAICAGVLSQSLLLPGTAMQQTFDGDSYIDSVLTEYTYTIIDSTQCRLDEITWWGREINPEVWMEQRKTIFTYDYQNRMITRQERDFDLQSRKWNSQKYYYTYVNDLLHTMHYFKETYDGFIDKVTYTYSYDTEHRKMKVEGSIYYSKIGYLRPLDKTVFYYDEFNRRSVDSTYNWSNSFYPIRIVKYSYDAENRLDSLLQMPTEFSLFSPSLSTYEYYDNGLLLRSTHHKLDNNWIPLKFEELRYDSTNTRPIFEIQKTWNPAIEGWVDSGRIKNEEFCTDRLEPAVANEQPLFRLFPNPGNELRLLALADIRNLNTITVMDIRGVVIFSQQFQWPHLDELRDRSRSFPNGFYFVSITSSNYRQDLKWIKIE